MSSIAILGSGFGLYGYLPALVACGQKIVLPSRYRERFEDRTELKPFTNQVQWAENEIAALQSTSGVVLAVSPSIQCKWLSICLDQPQLKYMFLEKPLAANPDIAAKLLSMLQHSGKVVRIAYVFRFQDWADTLRNCLVSNSSDTFRLVWRFQAHHFRNNLPTWKRAPEQGGGPLRFYGIHLVALLAEFGYSTVVRSFTENGNEDSLSRWRATFTGKDLPDFEVEIDTASTACVFSVLRETTRETVNVIRQPSTFSTGQVTTKPGSLDGRVDTLINFCQSAWSDQVIMPEFYRHTILLWKELEHVEHCNHSVRFAA